MKTCGSCRFFGKLIEASLDDYDDDGNTHENTKFHECTLLKHLNALPPKMAYSVIMQQPAGALDGSGYNATLCVSDEFGCNQHQPVSEHSG